MKKIIVLSTAAVLAMVFSTGCNSSDKKVSTLTQKMFVLEERLNSVEKRLDLIEERQNVFEQESTKQKEEAPAAASKMNDKGIQAALATAGFYTGAIDGIIGPNTKKAIMEFQAANGLNADGVVDSKTKAALAKYAKS
ncbi:MAG: peptidoglycan-binding protein [Candidatus Omnitrophica bacterium]|nr:peptidoglycan-binding protein [Candidatus Omnitrophota bacterium]